MEAAKQKTGQDAMAMGAQGGVQSGGSEYHLHSDEEKAEDA
jgi:hypothetical protein